MWKKEFFLQFCVVKRKSMLSAYNNSFCPKAILLFCKPDLNLSHHKQNGIIHTLRLIVCDRTQRLLDQCNETSNSEIWDKLSDCVFFSCIPNSTYGENTATEPFTERQINILPFLWWRCTVF